MKTTEDRNGLMEVYRASFKDFTAAAARLQDLPDDPIAQEMALAEVERARRAHSRSRDALVPVLLGGFAGPSAARCAERREAVVCCC
jgi:hypothetical protein